MRLSEFKAGAILVDDDGKVVHTLPLPPPRNKRMSEIIKVNH